VARVHCFSSAGGVGNLVAGAASAWALNLRRGIQLLQADSKDSAFGAWLAPSLLLNVWGLWAEPEENLGLVQADNEQRTRRGGGFSSHPHQTALSISRCCSSWWRSTHIPM